MATAPKSPTQTPAPPNPPAAPATTPTVAPPSTPPQPTAVGFDALPPKPPNVPLVIPSDPKLTREQKMMAALRQSFTKVEALVGAMYSHRGVCKKCGWQTYQHSEAAALELLDKHIVAHWRDVAALL